MLYLPIKAAISAIIIVAVSEIAKRYPGLGVMIAWPGASVGIRL